MSIEIVFPSIREERGVQFFLYIDFARGLTPKVGQFISVVLPVV